MTCLETTAFFSKSTMVTCLSGLFQTFPIIFHWNYIQVIMLNYSATEFNWTISEKCFWQSPSFSPSGFSFSIAIFPTTYKPSHSGAEITTTTLNQCLLFLLSAETGSKNEASLLRVFKLNSFSSLVKWQSHQSLKLFHAEKWLRDTVSASSDTKYIHQNILA